MKKIKVLVVEDEMVISMNLISILEDLGYEVLEPAISFDEAVEVLATQKPDIVLLDIQIYGNKNGVDLGHHINATCAIPFIFISSNSDSNTIKEAKETNPSSYLLKPFNQDDIFTSIEIALHNYRDKKEKLEDKNVVIRDSIFVKNKNMFYKVTFDEIVFIKSEHVYMELHTKNDKKHLIRGSLTAFSERLPKNFFRTHRSYLVNLNFLDAINSIHVVVNNTHVPIGKTYRTDLMASIHIE